jgi:glycosyltransferase involved in cell wall biosynthesis
MNKSKLMIIRSASALGGAEKYVLNLLSGLFGAFECVLVSDLKELIEEVKRKNLAKTIYLRWGREMWGKKEKILFFIFWPLNFLKFLFLFLKEKPAIIFCQSLNDKLIATPAAFILGINIFWIEHGPIFGFLTSFKPLIWFYKLNSLFVKKIIVVSRVTLDNFLSIGIKPEKITLIYNGIDLKKFEISPKQKLRIKKEFDLENFQVVGMVSRLVKNKGQDFLIKAAPYILKIYPKVKFLIIGEGPDRKILEEEIKKKELSKNVILTGFRKDIPSLLSVLDVFVHPSYTKTEGLPYSILEAQAAQKPVVVTDVGGCKEALEDGKTGFLIKARDEKILAKVIISLLKNPKLGQKMGKRGREFIKENFNLDKSIKKTVNLFKQ